LLSRCHGPQKNASSARPITANDLSIHLTLLGIIGLGLLLSILRSCSPFFLFSLVHARYWRAFDKLRAGLAKSTEPLRSAYSDDGLRAQHRAARDAVRDSVIIQANRHKKLEQGEFDKRNCKQKYQSNALKPEKATIFLFTCQVRLCFRCATAQAAQFQIRRPPRQHPRPAWLKLLRRRPVLVLVFLFLQRVKACAVAPREQQQTQQRSRGPLR
jgi:hypothetical protein